MKLHPRVTRPLLELVKRFEGLRRRAARLPDGRHTIGYGHVQSARGGVEVGPEDAEALLRWDLAAVANRVEAWCFAPLNQNQFEALVAFAFNIGLENFRTSEVLRRVNAGDALGAAEALERWRYADVGGDLQQVDALVRRRAAEKIHFLTPPEGFPPSPSQVLRPREAAGAGPSPGVPVPAEGAPVPGSAPLGAFPGAGEPPPPPLEADAPFPHAGAVSTPQRAIEAPPVPRAAVNDPFLEPRPPARGGHARRRSMKIALVVLGGFLFLSALVATLLGRAPGVSLAMGLLGVLIAAVGGVDLLREGTRRS